MRSMKTVAIVFGIVAMVTMVMGAASAQTPAAPATPPPAATPVTPPAGSAASGFGGTGTVILALLGLLIIVGIGVKLYDLRRKREADAVHLQAQISDALLREASLMGMPVTPTVHVPTWSGSPAVIEVSGQVPTPEAKESALRLIESEARRVRSDFRIEDRIAVVRTMTTRVA